MESQLLLGRDTHRDLAALLQAQRRLVVSGLSNETAKAMLTGHLLRMMSPAPTPILLVTQSDASVEGLRHWLHFFDIPAVPLLPIEDEDGNADAQALQQFLLFSQGGPQVFLTSRTTWEQPLPLLKELTERRLVLTKGEDVAFTEFVEALLDRGYTHGTDIYLQPSEYRRTGDVLDIFPIQCAHPYRVHFEYDKVTKIQAVDRADLSKVHDAGEELAIFPAIYERRSPLEAQFPKKGLLILDDQDDVEAPAAPHVLRYTAFPEGAANHAHLRYLSVLKFYTLTDFLNDVRDKLQQDWRILIVTRRLDELKGILTEEKVSHTTDGTSRGGAVTLLDAGDGELLPHSLQNPDLKCALLTDREIFTLRKSAKQRSIQKLALDFITSLSPEDYVVHMEHGIGRFEGMTQKMIDGTLREYLELTYAENDKLFIPVDQADKLSKYVTEEGTEPVLTRLGTSEWKKVTERMRKETQEIARELLGLYAKRASAKGFAFPEVADRERAFAEAFPFEVTPGQQKAIEDIRDDMEDTHPMDRLICGDVGFGKTEVAMRAAFKAVQAGKQVAVIAPITILADQHERSFKERMKNFKIAIDMLSRFRTPKEQRVTLEALRKGDVDIIIGTHRLLQDDVKFHNLGLVIVDEEQRFGVKQKERFKELRASVDILTLTATPIPRTLNLGLHKLRDITTITTPPPGRLPIITEVRKYSDQLVRQAILQEVGRKGQCFVLHNRVETIDAFADKLRKLIPEATFIVGHGQLKPDDLEERIIAFKDGKFDVLVSSTIIENGIDLPRANTLIVNEAERFGLAQLYQLRGRVGRSKLQAYAYFLYHTQKLQDDAKKRLRAIVEACELGSGFQVAMRDLEIRGAGEILGMSQSGTMQTVGISHYLRMLKNAVEELRSGGEETEQLEENVEILLPVEAFIPSFTIPDPEERISMYQKLAGSEDESILSEFEADLRAEYGEPPKQVRNLFAVLRLKMTCRRVGITRIRMEDVKKGERDIVLHLSGRVTAQEIMKLVGAHPQWRISSATLRVTDKEILKNGDQEKWLGDLAKQVAMLERKKVEKKEK
jgi:transcription-repair coupling factor